MKLCMTKAKLRYKTCKAERIGSVKALCAPASRQRTRRAPEPPAARRSTAPCGLGTRRWLGEGISATRPTGGRPRARRCGASWRHGRFMLFLGAAYLLNGQLEKARDLVQPGCAFNHEINSGFWVAWAPRFPGIPNAPHSARGHLASHSVRRHQNAQRGHP
jgi:hypothetical protein